MHIYHALINALGAHMIHINLNMILYTHVEDSPTKPTHTKQDTEPPPPIPPPHPRTLTSIETTWLIWGGEKVGARGCGGGGRGQVNMLLNVHRNCKAY